MGLQNYQNIARLRNFTPGLVKVLRDIYHEITHLLKFAHHIHIIYACLVVLVSGFDVFYLLLAQEVSLIVDVVLGGISVGNLFQSAAVRCFQVVDHDGVCLIYKIDQTVEFLDCALVKLLLVDVFS